MMIYIRVGYKEFIAEITNFTVGQKEKTNADPLSCCCGCDPEIEYDLYMYNDEAKYKIPWFIANDTRFYNEILELTMLERESEGLSNY